MDEKRNLDEALYRGLMKAWRELWCEQRMDVLKAQLKRSELAAWAKIENSNKIEI